MKLRYVLVVLCGAILAACQPEIVNDNPYTLVDKDRVFFDRFVTKSNLPKNNKFERGILLSNDDYPIHIALYKDRKFYYDLPTLGDGTGTWKYVKGKLSLYAERRLFVMQMVLTATEELGDEIIVQFTDRKGTQNLPMTVSYK